MCRSCLRRHIWRAMHQRLADEEMPDANSFSYVGRLRVSREETGYHIEYHSVSYIISYLIMLRDETWPHDFTISF